MLYSIERERSLRFEAALRDVLDPSHMNMEECQATARDALARYSHDRLLAEDVEGGHLGHSSCAR